MAFNGFLSFGGTEVANASRFVAYCHELVPSLDVSDCWDCADLAEVLGDRPYATPMVDQPDWFDQRDPDSWDFCGFYPLEIEGIDDAVRTSEVTQLAVDGAVMGAPRYAGRELRITGLLVGASDAAVTYGLRWLSKALEGSPCRDATGCTGDHLCYYAACPPMCTDSPALEAFVDGQDEGRPFYLCDGGMVQTTARACSLEYERTLYQVTTTSGPTTVERYNSACASMIRVEFTMVAGVPFAFSTAISAVPGAVPIPVPQITDEVSCDPGSQITVRTNLATNPVPIGNAAVAGGGWLAGDGDGYDVAVDTDVAIRSNGASVRMERTAVQELDNLATNPGPVDDLTGWGWQTGQSPPPGLARENLVPDPRITDVLLVQGGQASLWTQATQGTGATDGLSYKRVEVTQDATAGVVLGSSATPYPQGSASAVPGQAYAVGMDVRTSKPMQVTLRVVWRDADYVYVGAENLSSFITTGSGWQRTTGVGTAVEGAVYAQVAIVLSYSAGSETNPVVGDTIDVGRRYISLAAQDGPYFDGNTPDSASYRYAWQDEENSSVSTATPVLAPAVSSELVDDGDGPGQDTYMRTTIVDAKYGGQDGPTYTQAAGPGLYTASMQVRVSDGVRGSLQVSALNADGVVLASTLGPVMAVPAATWSVIGAQRLQAPAGTTRLRVAMLMPGDVVLPGGETFDAAAVRIVEGLYETGNLIGALTYVGQHDDADTTLEVIGGAQYTASVHVGSSVAALAVLSATFYDAAGVPVQLVRGPAEQVQARAPGLSGGVAQWARPSVQFTAPAGTAAVVLDVEVSKVISGAEVGDKAWATSALVEQVPQMLSYFDGSFPDVGDISYEWSGTAHASTSFVVQTLAEADIDIILDPDCPVVPPPPSPPLIDVSCVDTPTQWRRYVVTVDEDLVPVWHDAVPVVRLQTGASEVRQVRVRFYPNPLETAMAALDPCSYCGEFVVTYIPPRSEMVIDGIRQWASVTDADGVVRTANHLLASSDGGPVSWPLLGCGVGYTLVVDVSPTEVQDLSPQICLAARS